MAPNSLGLTIRVLGILSKSNWIDVGLIPLGSLFPEASVSYLAYVNSDHCPLLLKLLEPPLFRRERPFQFQLMWNGHLEFKDIIREAWRENILHDAIIEFTVKVKKWNKKVFGNIFSKKKRLVARLIGIQKALANTYLPRKRDLWLDSLESKKP